jgi:hypothetical protein
MTVEDDETIMPMKLVRAKPQGIVNNCDHRALFGVRANPKKD